MDELIRKSDAIDAIKRYALEAYDINLERPEEFAGKSANERFCEGLFEATEVVEGVEMADDRDDIVRCKIANCGRNTKTRQAPAKHLPNFTLPTANDSCDLYESEELDAVDLEEVCEVRKFTSPFVDTIEGMLSPDYKERFRAEYIQTKIRYERLKAFNTKIEAAFRTECERPEVKKAPMPPHDCPHDLLREQQEVMGHYLHILEVRAVIEGVDLGGC